MHLDSSAVIIYTDTVRQLNYKLDLKSLNFQV